MANRGWQLVHPEKSALNNAEKRTLRVEVYAEKKYVEGLQIVDGSSCMERRVR